jgi:hypothetical protein
MAAPYIRVEVGDTKQFTWSAATDPLSLSLAIKTASETLVASLAAVTSGTGNWYVYVTIPDSFGKYPCHLMQEWTAIQSTHANSRSPFITRQVFEVTKTLPFEQGRTQ